MAKRSTVRTATIAAGMLSLAAAVSASAPMPPILTQQLAKADSNFHAKGWRTAGWEHWGTVSEGSSERLVFSVPANTVFAMQAICDKGCDNLDLKASDSKNNVVSSDSDPDDYPVVKIPASEKTNSFWIDVIMTKCKTASCAYGIRAYVQ